MCGGGASPYDFPERASARHYLASLLTAQQLPLVLTERQLAAQQRCQNGEELTRERRCRDGTKLRERRGLGG